MNYLADILYDLAPYTHFISFLLLLLAGLNFPISEDLVFIISASISATVIPENTFIIFTGCFLGAFFSDIIAYTFGRYAWRRILDINFFKKRFPSEKMERVERFFQNYGGKTLFFGRFIPFGVRNILFMSAGIARLNIIKFMLIDLCALCLTSSILFYLGYSFGENYKIIIPYLNRYKFIIIAIFVAAILIFVYRKRKLKELN